MDLMQKRENGLAGGFPVFFFLRGFSQASGAATLFPNRGRGWNKIPTVVIAGKEGEPRAQLVIEAVDFWNNQLSEIGSGFRLGPVSFTNETIPAAELEARSRAVLAKEGALPPTPSLINMQGDL